MIDKLETWLFNKSKNTSPKFWAKVVGFLVAIASAAVFFIKYNAMKQAGEKAELQNVLAKDDIADAVRNAEQHTLEVQKSQILANAASNIEYTEALQQSVKTVTAVAKDDQAVINSIDSWAKVDSTVKDKK